MSTITSVSYTNHVGTVRKNGSKDNSISNLAKLIAAEKHANHDYTQAEVDKMSSDIDLSKRYQNRLFENQNGNIVEINGYFHLVKRTREAYEKVFGQAIVEYNERMDLQGKGKKKIDRKRKNIFWMEIIE